MQLEIIQTIQIEISLDTEEICIVHFCIEIHMALTLLWSVHSQVEGTPEIFKFTKESIHEYVITLASKYR
jgi:hypothetical protein